MPKKRHRDILNNTLLATAALFLLIGVLALGFLQSLSREDRALIIIITGVGLIVCFAGMLSVNSFWKWLRRSTWRRAMLAWRESTQARNAPRYDLDYRLSRQELRNLAIQAYSRMGYIRSASDGGEGAIRLVNPEGRIELVTCQPQPAPADIQNMLDLQREMKKAEAVRGFFWSPSGFTNEARHWTKHRPIILADRDEICRLVDCSREKGSSLLEYGWEDR